MTPAYRPAPRTSEEAVDAVDAEDAAPRSPRVETDSVAGVLEVGVEAGPVGAVLEVGAATGARSGSDVAGGVVCTTDSFDPASRRACGRELGAWARAENDPELGVVGCWLMAGSLPAHRAAPGIA